MNLRNLPLRKLLALTAVTAVAPLAVAALAQSKLVKDLWPNDNSGIATFLLGASAEVASGEFLYLDYVANSGDGLWHWDAATGPRLVKSFANSTGSVGLSFGGLPGSSSGGSSGFPGGGPGFPGSVSSFSGISSGPTALSFNGKYFFTGIESGLYGTGTELWSSDGSSAGTALFKDLWEGHGASTPTGFVAFNGLMYFFAKSAQADGSGYGVYGLWRSDGSEAGTVLLKEVANPYDSITNVQVANGLLYFYARPDSTFGTLITSIPWVSDGTVAGTVAMTLAGGAPVYATSNAVVADDTGRYYFCANEPNDVVADLYVADGSAGSVSKVFDTGGSSSGGGFYYGPGPGCQGVLGSGAGGTVFFGADESNQPRVWRSDGSQSGTMAIATDAVPQSLPVAHEGLRYFQSGGQNPGLWRLNPATAGLEQVMGFVKSGGGGLGNTPYAQTGDLLRVRNGNLYFVNSDCNGPCGLYRIAAGSTAPEFLSNDETEFVKLAGLSRNTPPFPRPALIDNGSGIGNSNSGRLPVEQAMVEMGNSQVLFEARSADSSNGRSLFLSNGSLRRTRLIQDGSVRGQSLPFQGGVVLAQQHPGATSTTLDYIDADGTRTELASFPPGIFSGNQLSDHLTALGGQVFFAGNYQDENSTLKRALWVWTPGSAPQRLKDIAGFTNGGGGLGERFQVAGGLLYFFAGDASGGVALWKSDGSSDGTVQVAHLGDYSLAPPQFLGAVGSRVICLITDDNTGVKNRRIVASDGSAAGTEELVNVPGFEDPYDGAYYNTNTAPVLANLPVGETLGSRLLFQFADPANGFELWQTDGTVGGTHLFKNLYAGARGSYPSDFTLAGSKLYFVADGGAGRELWTTDGTATGTVQVADIQPGKMAGAPYNLRWQADLSRLVFGAISNANGTELWQSDGTSAGTELLADINPGVASSAPEAFSRAGPRLVFVADAGAIGREPHAVALAPLPPEAPLVLVENIAFPENAEPAARRFAFRLEEAATEAIDVDWQLADGTATTADGDYSAASGTVHFAPGETEAFVALEVFNDELTEGDETFSIRLSTPTNAELLTPQATATIFNDDAQVQFMPLMTTSGEWAYLFIDAGSIGAARFDAPPAGAPENYQYPFGFLYLDVVGLTPGQAMNAFLQLPSGQAIDSFIKCLPAECGAYANASLYSGAVSFSLFDGGPGDADGMANGSIRDPGAPALLAQLYPFSFIERSNVPASKFVTSEAVTITGNSTLSVPFSIGNGQYSLNGGNFTNVQGRLKAGDRLVVRHISAAEAATETLSYVYVNGSITQFRSVTSVADFTPDAFSFVSQTGLAPGARATSAALTLTGFNTATVIEAGPDAAYSINGAAFTSARGKLKPGESLRVQHTANSNKLGYTKSYVKVGGVMGTFTTRTRQ